MPVPVSNGSPATYLDSGASIGEFLVGHLTTDAIGRRRRGTRFVCGYFGCERHADRLFLAGLPLMIKINLRGDPTGEWLESSVRHLVSQAGSARPGQAVLLSKMAEALFIETIRRYMEALPPEQTGWLAGAGSGRRRRTGAAAPKTLSSLDRGATCRRDRRFALGPGREVLPVSRQAAADLSRALAIAARRQDAANHAGGGDTGGLRGRVNSEAAFNRAFKREFGVPPGQFRRSCARSELVGGTGQLAFLGHGVRGIKKYLL